MTIPLNGNPGDRPRNLDWLTAGAAGITATAEAQQAQQGRQQARISQQQAALTRQQAASSSMASLRLGEISAQMYAAQRLNQGASKLETLYELSNYAEHGLSQTPWWRRNAKNYYKELIGIYDTHDLKIVEQPEGKGHERVVKTKLIAKENEECTSLPFASCFSRGPKKKKNYVWYITQAEMDDAARKIEARRLKMFGEPIVVCPTQPSSKNTIFRPTWVFLVLVVIKYVKPWLIRFFDNRTRFFKNNKKTRWKRRDQSPK